MFFNGRYTNSEDFLRWEAISQVFCQIREKKLTRSKIEEGVLRSFRKRQKWIPGEILPGSYTSIFFSTFFFIEKK